MFRVTNREIAVIAVALIVGTGITALVLTECNAARAVALVAERIAAGAHDGIIAAAIIAPIAVIIKHAIVLQAYGTEDVEIGRN